MAKREPGRLDVRPPYGQTKPEAAMIKTIPPIEDKNYDDIPVDEQTVVEDGKEPGEEAQTPDGIQELTRKAPVQMKFVITKTEDYDSPFRIDVEETGPAPDEDSEELECPHCGERHAFRQASMQHRKVLTCPSCKQKISSTAIIKTASCYKVVMPKIASKDTVKDTIRAVYEKLQAAFEQLREQKEAPSSTTTAISEISAAIGRLESLLNTLSSKVKE